MSPSEEPQSSPHTTQLALRLKRLRAEHGLCLSQPARATGIASSFLSLIEQARTDITFGRLVRPAEFYDLELADLLDRPPTAPSDHVRMLRAEPDHMLRSPTEGVDVHDLTRGARWTLGDRLDADRHDLICPAQLPVAWCAGSGRSLRAAAAAHRSARQQQPSRHCPWRGIAVASVVVSG